jgi:probable F420-dependent oxidoreductase
VADGILVMPFNSGRHMRERTVPAIARGLATARRTLADLEITVEVIVGVGRTAEELEAARGVRNLLAFYGSTPAYRPVLDVEGWGDLQPELNTLSKRGHWREMSDLIDDGMLRTLAVHGTPDQCASEIARRFPDCDRICAYFPFYPVTDELIADFVRAVKAHEPQ